MSSEFEALIERLSRCPGAPGEISEGFRKAVAVCEIDPEMSLTRSRKVLEFVVRDLYERRIHEPPGTRPLENLLQRLVKDELIPTRLEAYATTVRKLGNVGTHTFGEPVSRGDVFQSLSQLLPILEWYYPATAEAAAVESNGNFLEQAFAQPMVRIKSEAAPPILPKGLRSFDSTDSDFYLRLLPGPFDAEGLPESIRFWKNRLEQTEELPFTVGMIYGPSGCGKSSVVKAGLLPRLASWISAVYVEASAHNTEVVLAAELARRFPECKSGSLPERLARLRDASENPRRRVLVVIDQFEQWLAAHDADDDLECELVRALRQCDGRSLFCIVLVRDDFWMAASRFMRHLGLPLLEGRNCQAVDLFDARHAKNVLLLFGQAYGALPANSADLEGAQREFLDEAVRGLADDGKIVCVRLALFAEMIKGQPWTPQTLAAVGGARGVGVTFLEEAFGRTAPTRRRRHEQAARNILEALLPDKNTAIKGRARSRTDLLAASGYAERPEEFDDLLQILNQELRLIAPTQQDGTTPARTEEPGRGEPYFQLTHDYLVPSVREWIERRQRQSRRGRAELLLAEQSQLWNERPEPRRLPTLWEWCEIWRQVPKDRRTDPQRQFIRAATYRHVSNAAILTLMILVGLIGGFLYREHELEKRHQANAEALVDTLLVADSDQVPDLLRQIDEDRAATEPYIREQLETEKLTPEGRVYALLALSPYEPNAIEPLRQEILSGPPERFALVRNELAAKAQDHVPWLRTKLEEHLALPADLEFLRLVQTLALYDPAAAMTLPPHAWPPFTKQLLRTLADDPKLFGSLAADLRPVRNVLYRPLLECMRDEEQQQSDRERATALLAELASDEPAVLVRGLLDSDQREFERLYGAIAAQPVVAKQELNAALAQAAPAEASYAMRELLVRRQASAAVALWRLGEQKAVLPLLAWSADNGRRTYILHWLGPRGVKASTILEQFHSEKDISIRRALLYAVRACTVHPLDPREMEDLSTELVAVYRSDADAGLRAAIDWLLRSWGHEGKLQTVDRELAQDFTHAKLADAARDGKPRWFVNSRGQTFSVLPSPATFTMGSPANEPGRQTDAQQLQETQHQERIGRRFALGVKQVTVADFQEFLATKPSGVNHSYWSSYAPTPECSQTAVTWFEAAAYCRWLSEQEKVPEDQMCFPTIDKIVPGLVLPENYLSRTGYRMPTEAEWEYACRAGATTARFYGETDTMLQYYAIYERNTKRHTVPGGTLKGNDWGLFDTLGNGWDWCLNPAVTYPMADASGVVLDVEDRTPVNSLPERILRGGGLATRPEEVRAACRFRQKADARLDYLVFRLALTLPAEGTPAPAPQPPATPPATAPETPPPAAK